MKIADVTAFMLLKECCNKVSCIDIVHAVLHKQDTL